MIERLARQGSRVIYTAMIGITAWWSPVISGMMTKAFIGACNHAREVTCQAKDCGERDAGAEQRADGAAETTPAARM